MKNPLPLIRILLLYAVTIAIVGYALGFVGLQAIFEQLRNANGRLLSLSFVLTFGFVVLSGQKLKMLVETTGRWISFARSQKITWAVYPLNVVLPSKGGDFVKSWALRDIMPLSQSVGIIILERLIDLMVLCLMAMGGSYWRYDPDLIIPSLSILFIGALFFWMLIKTGNLKTEKGVAGIVKNVGVAARCLLASPRLSVPVISISIVIWLGSALQAFLLYAAVGETIPFDFCFAVFPIAVFIGLLPVTIAGMGTRDLAMVYLFSGYANDSASLSVGLLYTFARYWLPALIGIPFLHHLKTGNPAVPPKTG